MTRGIQIRDKEDRLVNPGERHTMQRDWVNAGSITAVVAAGQSPIDVDKRADSDITSLSTTKKITHEPEDGTVNIEIRVRADGNNDDEFPIQMLVEAGEDHFTKIADMNCIQGTQDGDDDEHFCDDIELSNSDWETSLRVIDAQAEYIARLILNTHGHSKFLWVCTDLKNADTIYIDVRRAS